MDIGAACLWMWRATGVAMWVSQWCEGQQSAQSGSSHGLIRGSSKRSLNVEVQPSSQQSRRRSAAMTG